MRELFKLAPPPSQMQKVHSMKAERQFGLEPVRVRLWEVFSLILTLSVPQDVIHVIIKYS